MKLKLKSLRTENRLFESSGLTAENRNSRGRFIHNRTFRDRNQQLLNLVLKGKISKNQNNNKIISLSISHTFWAREERGDGKGGSAPSSVFATVALWRRHWVGMVDWFFFWCTVWRQPRQRVDLLWVSWWQSSWKWVEKWGKFMG